MTTKSRDRAAPRENVKPFDVFVAALKAAVEHLDMIQFVKAVNCA